MDTLYKIVKLDGMYRVVTASNNKVLFSSARRINCKDWLREILGVEL
jgi:hypothetical protein